VKKIAVSFSRWAADLLDKAPVSHHRQSRIFVHEGCNQTATDDEGSSMGVSVALEPGALFNQFRVKPPGELFHCPNEPGELRRR
jgi:hypothetical protein